MLTLSDLPRRLPDLQLIIVHGGGRGGGEFVAEKILTEFAAAGRAIDLVAASDRAGMVRAIRSQSGNPGIRILFTAGMRDLPGALAAKMAGVLYATYLQVPYFRAMSLRDPVHAAAVTAMTAFHRMFAAHNFVNSQASWPGWFDAETLAPITADELNADAPSAPLPPSGGLTIATACRLFTERGIGSKDTTSLLRLIDEIRRHNRAGAGGRQVQLVHYGDVDDTHAAMFSSHADVIQLRGYSRTWLYDDAEIDAFFFFSRYEGFGLAPLEATKTNRPVFVNEGFPDELRRCCPVETIITRDPRCSILEQIIQP